MIISNSTSPQKMVQASCHSCAGTYPPTWARADHVPELPSSCGGAEDSPGCAYSDVAGPVATSTRANALSRPLAPAGSGLSVPQTSSYTAEGADICAELASDTACPALQPRARSCHCPTEAFRSNPSSVELLSGRAKPHTRAEPCPQGPANGAY